MSSFYSSFKLLSFESFDVFINIPFGLIYYYLDGVIFCYYILKTD